MNSQLIPFDFENKTVRMMVLEDREWWVGKDVCEALKYSNDREAISRHCKGVVNHYPLQTSGGVQEVRILSEGDVWRLITHSKLPEAQRFEKWLFEEVLPQIRKTGAYVPEGTVLVNKETLKGLEGRILRLETNQNVTEKLLIRSQRTIRRYEEQRSMTYTDKREILTLYVNKYSVSDIQRITKKGRTAIKRFLDWFFSLDGEAFETELKKITHEDFWSEEFLNAAITVSQKPTPENDDEPSESFSAPLEGPQGHDGGGV